MCYGPIMTAPTVETVEFRLAELTAEYCTAEYVSDYYGFVAGDAAFTRAERWGAMLRSPRPLRRDSGIDRRLLERFLQNAQLLPRKWAAAELGMIRDSFDLVVAQLAAQGPFLTIGQEVSPDLVSKGFVSSFSSLFRATANLTNYSSRSAKCRAVHDAIQQELGIAVTPLLCETSRRLVATTNEPPDCASGFDCISLEPVSQTHQVWLDFAKPMSLPPDVTSKLSFAAYPDQLRTHLFGGREPQLDDALRAAATAWLGE